MFLNYFSFFPLLNDLWFSENHGSKGFSVQFQINLKFLGFLLFLLSFLHILLQYQILHDWFALPCLNHVFSSSLQQFRCWFFFCLENYVFHKFCGEMASILFWLFPPIVLKERCLCMFHQVEASTNQVPEQQMKIYDLPSKILCRVLNVELKVTFWALSFLQYWSF